MSSFLSFSFPLFLCFISLAIFLRHSAFKNCGGARRKIVRDKEQNFRLRRTRHIQTFLLHFLIIILARHLKIGLHLPPHILPWLRHCSRQTSVLLNSFADFCTFCTSGGNMMSRIWEAATTSKSCNQKLQHYAELLAQRLFSEIFP